MLPIVDEFDAKYKFIGSTSTEFYIMTNLSAPFNKIIKVNIKDPDWVSVNVNLKKKVRIKSF